MAQTRDTQGWPPESALDAGDADENNASGRYLTGRGIRWYACDKCGQMFPSTEVAICPVTGLRLCLTGPHDFDEYDHDPRITGNFYSRVYPEETRK